MPRGSAAASGAVLGPAPSSTPGPRGGRARAAGPESFATAGSAGHRWKVASRPSSSPIAGAALPTSGQKIGWSFGDVPSDSQDRRLTITYTAVVADVVGNAAGDTLTNSATPYWSAARPAASSSGNQ